ncbi:hypothetical protein ACHWQZ_G006236 [Mnemiopsis leidyi]
MSLSLHQIIYRTLKTSRKRKDDFLLALQFLISGHKPAILFDFCSVTTKQLENIVEQAGLKEVVVVVKLLDDVILVDKRHDFERGYSPEFVDCSLRKGTPDLAGSQICERYHVTFRKMLNMLREAGKTQTIVDLDSLCPGMCLTTIFGMFLQYPYVYYTDDHGNCLAGVQLILVELGLSVDHDTDDFTSNKTDKDTCYVFTTFSVPKSICHDEEALTSLPFYLKRQTVCLNSVAM